MNPFFSSDGSFDISGTVGGLSLTGLDGLIIPVSNLKENIEVNPLFPDSNPLFPFFFPFSINKPSFVIISEVNTNAGSAHYIR